MRGAPEMMTQTVCVGVSVVLVTRQAFLGMASLLGETLFELSGQGPAPMKDYFHFAITSTEVCASFFLFYFFMYCYTLAAAL